MNSPHPGRSPLRRLAPLLAALAAVFAFAPTAQAAKLTFTVGGDGAKVTLSDTPNPADASAGDAFAPGSKIYLTGTGFVGTGGTGFPQICIKLNDVDGELSYDNVTPEFEPTLPTFQAEPDGSWHGWVQLTNGIALNGPDNGKHWLRVLSGVPSSGTNVTVPITYRASFRVQPDLEAGFTNTAGSYFAGSTLTQGPLGAPAPNSTTPSLPAGPAFTVTGAPGKLDPNEPVAISLGGTPLTANKAGTTTAVTTEADGSFRAWTSVPAGSGDRVLRAATSTKSEEITLSTVAHAATLQTPNVRPGGTAVVSVSGFIGIDGKPQKVALVGRGPNSVGTVTDDAVLACEQTSSAGAATLIATIHPTAAAGAGILRVAAGTNCVPPLVSEPLPRFIPSVGLNISTTAPQAGTTFTRGSVGLGFPVTGAGYAAGESVQPKIDGVNAGSALVANASGEITGSVTIPAGATLGKKLLTFAGTTSTTAADTIEAIAAPKAEITNTGDIAQGSTLQIKVTGFIRGFARDDASLGQKVALRLDAGRDILACITTDDSGNGTGTLALPAEFADGEHTLQVLAGSACVSGASNDAPSRTVPTKFQVKNPVVIPTTPDPTTPTTPVEDKKPDPTPIDNKPQPTTPVVVEVQEATKVKTLKGGKQIEIAIDAGSAPNVKVEVKSSSKYKLTKKGKSKIVTIVKSKTINPKNGQGRSVQLTLTADGKALLKKLGKLKVKITITPTGAGTATTRTFTLRK